MLPRRDARRDRVMTSIAPGVSMARGGSSVVAGRMARSGPWRQLVSP